MGVGKESAEIFHRSLESSQHKKTWIKMSVGSAADIRPDLMTSAASVDDRVATKSKTSCTDSLTTAKDCAKSSKRLKRLRSRRNNEDKQIIEEGWENSHEA